MSDPGLMRGRVNEKEEGQSVTGSGGWLESN